MSFDVDTKLGVSASPVAVHPRGGRADSVLAEGRFALGIAVGFISCLLLTLSLQFLRLAPSRQEIIDLTPTLIALLVALVSLVIAYHALGEQKRMRQAGTDPVILAHLGQREDDPMILNLCITNVGAGAAINVRFQTDLDPSELTARKALIDLTALTHPIRAIPQNSSVRYNLGVGFEVAGDDPLPPFLASVEYEDIEGRSYASQQLIDVREMYLRPANRPAVSDIRESARSVAKSLGAIQRTLERLKLESDPQQGRTR